MLLPRAYRCLTQSPTGDTLLIVTDTRARALHYFLLMLRQPGWTEQRVEVGTRAYTEYTMEQLP